MLSNQFILRELLCFGSFSDRCIIGQVNGMHYLIGYQLPIYFHLLLLLMTCLVLQAEWGLLGTVLTGTSRPPAGRCPPQQWDLPGNQVLILWRDLMVSKIFTAPRQIISVNNTKRKKAFFHWQLLLDILGMEIFLNYFENMFYWV